MITWLAVVVGGSAALAADPDVRLLDADRRLVDTQLDNGLHVTILEDPRMPMVATQHWVHVGSAQEGPSERGFAHLYEHLMFGDTPAHPARDYARLHTASGGVENAWTAFDETVYVSLVAPERHDALLALEADRFGTLVVSADNLANEQRIVTEELRLRTQNDPFSRLFVTALDRALAGHPYAHTPAGTMDDIAAADLALCQRFQARWYRPDHIHLVVVGPRPVETVLASVEALYGALTPSDEPAAVTPSILDATLPAEVDLAEDLPPIRITALAWLLPPTGHPDDAALTVLLELLAGGEVDRFEERHVTQTHRALYGETLHERLKAGGALGVYGVSFFKGRKAAFAALERTVGELDDLSWLTDASVQAARRRLLRARLEAAYHPEVVADAIGRVVWESGSIDAWLGADDDLRAVTTDDVARVWRTWVAGAEPHRLFLHHGRPQ